MHPAPSAPVSTTHAILPQVSSSPALPNPAHPPEQHHQHSQQRLISVAQLVRNTADHDSDHHNAQQRQHHQHHHHHHRRFPDTHHSPAHWPPSPPQHHHVSPPRRPRPPDLDPRSATRSAHKNDQPDTLFPAALPSVIHPPPTAPLGSVPLTGPPPLPPSAPDPDIKRYAKLLTPFIYKLYSLVTDAATNDLCDWAPNGTSFIVHDHDAFSAKVLPLYFKHNQFTSFVRQLNKYSFHKLAPGAYVYGHTHFRQNRPDLLLHIGPPRPQERGAERNRLSAAGGASLSSLQRVQPPPSDLDLEQISDRVYTSTSHRLHMDNRIPPIEPVATIPTERYAGYDVVSSRPDTIRQGYGGDRTPMDRAAIEEMMQQMQRGLAQELSRDFSMARNERETLLRRVCALERMNEELNQRLMDANRRIEQLERANHDFGMRKRRSEYADPSASSKRMRGPEQREDRY